MKNLKVTIVTPFAMPELGANALRVDSLAKYLKGSRVEVEIFAMERNQQPDTKEVKRYRKITELMWLIYSSNSNAVIFTSPPITHGFFAGIAARLSGKKFFLDIRDPWPFAAEMIGQYSKYSPKLFFYRALNFLAYLLAEKIFVVTRGIAEDATKKGFGEKTVLAPNGATGEFAFNPKYREIIRKKLGVAKSTVLCIYSGSFERKDVDSMVMSFKKLPQNYHLLMLLPNTTESAGEYYRIKQLAQEHLRGRNIFVEIHGVPLSKVIPYFSAADIGISTVPEVLEYCIAVKTYDYASSGLFVLAKGPKKGSLKELFSKHEIGKYCADWSEFEKFMAPKNELSYQAREKRHGIARRHFDRRFTNEIIYRHVFGEQVC